RQNMRNAKFATDPNPLDEKCPCDVCQNFSRAYLHHLLKAGEILALRCLSLHNITFYQQLMATIRRQIVAGTFAEWAAGYLAEPGFA
ncbi:MAG: tRNA-guanine transglycosylase, partial [bacterium]